MTFSLRGFRVRLAGLIGGLSLLWAVAVAVYFDRATSAQIEQDSARALHTLAQSVTVALASNLVERQRNIELLAQLPALQRGELSGPDARAALTLTKSGYRHYAWLGVANAAGVVQLASGGLLEGVSVRQRPWFVQGSRGPFVGDLHEAVLLSKALVGEGAHPGDPLRFVDFAAPVFDAQGQLLGVVAAHTNWQWAREVMDAALPPGALDDGIEVLIVNAQGQVIYPQAMADKRVPDALLQGRTEAVWRWNDQQVYLGCSQWVKADLPNDLGWRVLVRQPLQTAMAPLTAMHRKLALLGGLGIVLLTATAFLFASRFSRPIERLARAARKVAQGRRANARFQAGSRVAELVILEDALRDMTSRLLDQREALQQANVTLEQRVAARTAELASLYDEAPVGYHTVDAQGVVQQINETELRLLGYARAEVEGVLPVLALFAPACQPIARERLAAMRRGERLPPQDATMQARDGRMVAVRLISTPVFDGQGQFVASRTAVMDVSDTRALEVSLQRQQAINHAIVHASPNGLLLYDASGQCVLANEAVAEMVGARVEQLLQQNFQALESWRVAGLTEAARQALSGQPVRHMASFTSSFGKQVECLVTLMALLTQGEQMLLVVFKDVTELVRANRELDQLARRDVLTGLVNRRGADEQLNQEFRRSQRSGAPFSVMMLDIDHFKLVNDRFGHDVGDQVLRQVAETVRGALRVTDVVARYGGEEFLVLLPDTDASEAEAVAEKVRQAVAARNVVPVGHITVSIGLTAMWPDASSQAQLLRMADQALYAAKAGGRDRVQVAPRSGMTGVMH